MDSSDQVNVPGEKRWPDKATSSSDGDNVVTADPVKLLHPLLILKLEIVLIWKCHRVHKPKAVLLRYTLKILRFELSPHKVVNVPELVNLHLASKHVTTSSKSVCNGTNKSIESVLGEFLQVGGDDRKKSIDVFVGVTNR